MARVALDFGTGNTVIGLCEDDSEDPQTIEIPGVTLPLEHPTAGASPPGRVHVLPSLIHYSASETLLGSQVLTRGLAEHRDTIRWMKRRIAAGVTARRKTPQGHKGPRQAGEDFLRLVLQYASDRFSLEGDTFTFTAPVEAFEDFQDWLRRIAEALGIARLRVLDEPTACVLGYRGAVRRDDAFLIFDFGCGTLDVSVVRVDLGSNRDVKAIQLGQAGLDLGGMDVDRWMLEDYCRRHGIEGRRRRELEPVILRRVEAAKISLSEISTDRAEVVVEPGGSQQGEPIRTVYLRSCSACERGRVGDHREPTGSCLGCLLADRGFLRQVRRTLERALENAAVKAGLRREEITAVFVTGGTSLIPRVRHLLEEQFEDRVYHASPFDSVARGACRGTVVPILQHDYAIESYSRDRKDYEFRPLFRLGTEYPTPKDAVRLWARGSHDGMTRIGLKIFEVSRMRQRSLDVALVDREGQLRDDTHVATDYRYICLNRENPTFIVADPPVNLQRDRRRFLCSFSVDGNRRLLVTVMDQLVGRRLLEDHPVVRL